MSGPMTSMAAMRSFRRDPQDGQPRAAQGHGAPDPRHRPPVPAGLTFFLLLVVGSSVIGVLTPLLAGDIVNRIARLDGTAGGIVRIALVIAVLAVVDAANSLAPAGTPRGSARASSTTCAARCSTTSSGCRSPSSPAPRPARWSAG